MSKKLLLSGRSNWETILFLIINTMTIQGKVRSFCRTQLLRSKNVDAAIMFSKILGHKARPEHPEETIQGTLQKMRDKGFILFKGNGYYELTPFGFLKMRDTLETVQKQFAK